MKKSIQPSRRKPKPAAHRSEAAPRSASSPSAPSAVSSIPIVGIGASAGGLEALEQFLGHVPPASGLAFVVVQHLDPTRKGLMVELLQRATAMPVLEIKDRTKVLPDRVYVEPVPKVAFSEFRAGVGPRPEPAWEVIHNLPPKKSLNLVF